MDPGLFIDFANRLEPMDAVPPDAGAEVAALREWLHSQHLIRRRLTLSNVERSLPAFRDLRQLILAITESVVDGGDLHPAQLAELNAVLGSAPHVHELRRGPDGLQFSVGQVGDELELARAAIAGSLAHFLAEHDLDRLRICANDKCRWRFVDRSPAGRRRWCDMRVCGNRAKVARHRARARAASA